MAGIEPAGAELTRASVESHVSPPSLERLAQMSAPRNGALLRSSAQVTTTCWPSHAIDGSNVRMEPEEGEIRTSLGSHVAPRLAERLTYGS